MKTRNEVEEYLKKLGIEIQSQFEDRESTEYGEEVVQTERYMPTTGEKVIEDNLKHDKIKVLNEDAKKALLDLVSQSITNGDMETAEIALEVLQEESGYYKGHRNAAIDNAIPLDKRIEFEQYCQTKNPEKQFTGPMAAFRASAHNIATNRREGNISGITAEIRSAAKGEQERENKEENTRSGE